MRITKSMATAAAQLMACKVYDNQIKAANDALSQHVTCIMANKIPDIVLQVCQQYSEMIHATNDVYAYWNGRRYGVVLPYKVPYNERSVLEKLRKEDCDKIVGLCKNILVRECDKENYRSKVESTLIALRTKQNIEKDFPEASEFIEWPGVKSLPIPVVPFELRALIRNTK